MVQNHYELNCLFSQFVRLQTRISGVIFFIDWVAPSQNGTKAYCKWCKIEVRPKKHTLMKHCQTYRHERAKNKQVLLNQSNKMQKVANV